MYHQNTNLAIIHDVRMTGMEFRIIFVVSFQLMDKVFDILNISCKNELKMEEFEHLCYLDFQNRTHSNKMSGQEALVYVAK
jgi:hypothetical protein